MRAGRASCIESASELLLRCDQRSCLFFLSLFVLAISAFVANTFSLRPWPFAVAVSAVSVGVDAAMRAEPGQAIECVLARRPIECLCLLCSVTFVLCIFSRLICAIDP